MEMSIRSDEGTGAPVVLLHGFPGNGSAWESVARQLANRHRIIICDLVGFDSSPRPSEFAELWADAQSQALAATLDGLGLEQVALVGHDMGGGIALAFLRAHGPDAGQADRAGFPLGDRAERARPRGITHQRRPRKPQRFG